ncbi:MAG: acetyl-CoA carboxylase biotin carboxylase subunit [Deltaproteobacteria bacterium]|nr:acetyl-CoA carboxylase biotin carboxylase subunit [Deltaproteobacteria bacterium]
MRARRVFGKLLVANRGEVAVRVMRACRELGIRVVAVYSDADRDALHVLSADEAVHIGPSPSAQSYLSVERVLDAARRTGADAIHPGYGFLSENADFARACEAAEIRFVGPPADVIEKMGEKTSARRIAVAAGVPVVPGTLEPVSDHAALAAEASRIGFPLMLKAAAGGGGKGLRLVREASELGAATTRAAGEARSAFGDDRLYLEKAIERPRHIEIQVLADSHGNAVHLFERECSIQRRHQKVIEESPSPFVTPELREQMGRLALRLVAETGYVNAGTLEFLVDRELRPYFLEMNTRLQVEHPVTEMVTGIDIVKQQIQIAAGEPLSFRQDEIAQRGHAIECRVYAEDPTRGFLPSPGRITDLRVPGGPGIRDDGGVYPGWTVPVEYDPLLSKLVAHAPTREGAIARLARAVAEYRVVGIRTTLPFFAWVLEQPAFLAGDIDTGFIDEHLPASFGDPPADREQVAAIAAARGVYRTRRARQARGSDQQGATSAWWRSGLTQLHRRD